MEEEITQTPVQEAQVPPVSQEQFVQPVQETPIEQPKKKSKLPLIAILLVVILLIAGGIYAGIKIGKRQAEGGLLQKTTLTLIPQPTEISTSVPTSDETADWKTYTKDSKNFGSFSIKYPEDWLVVEKKTEAPNGEQIITTISKTGYKIEINAFIDGWSPGGCNFDKTIRNRPQIGDYDSYVDIDNPSIKLRRALPSSKYENSLAWSICVKEDTSDSFATAFPFSGEITYFTPTNFGEIVIKEMDQILSTFKFLD